MKSLLQDGWELSIFVLEIRSFGHLCSGTGRDCAVRLTGESFGDREGFGLGLQKVKIEGYWVGSWSVYACWASYGPLRRE